MLRIFVTAGLFAAALHGQLAAPKIATPQFGAVRLADGSLHPVFGGPGSFVIGKRLFSGIQSASFSDQAGIVSFEDRIAVLDSNFHILGEQPAVGALVGISGDAETALAWVPASSTLLWWTPGGFQSTHVTGMPSGSVWSLQKAGRSVVLLSETSRITVSLATGEVTDCQPLLDSLLQMIAKEIGQQASDLAVEQAGNAYWHVLSRAGTRTWMVSVKNPEHFWEAPAPRLQQ